MDEQQLEHYRRKLLELSAELQCSLAGDGSTKPVAPDPAIGRLTRQDAIQSQQMALELRRRNKALLGQIDQALARVDDGSYGCRTRCEGDISESRLKVRPEAPVCIACAEVRRRD